MTSDSHAGDAASARMQQEVKATLQREGLASELPVTARFGEAGGNQVALAKEALDEVKKRLGEVLGNGAAAAG